MATGDPIKGTSGTCTSGATEIKYVKDWTYKTEYATTEAGPYINRDTIDEVAAGEKGELQINCDVREGGDAGQTVVLAAKGTRIPVTLTTDLGKVITIASGLVKSAEIKTEAKGTQTMAFTISGVAVISQDT